VRILLVRAVFRCVRFLVGLFWSTHHSSKALVLSIFFPDVHQSPSRWMNYSTCFVARTNSISLILGLTRDRLVFVLWAASSARDHTTVSLLF
jgi:hypothetical protein